MQANPAARTSGDLTGTKVGRFVIQARLGQGGMGEVYRADDTGLKRPVALKRILRARHADECSRKRLWREAQLASQLADPHIAAVYDVLEDGDELFVVMEYVEGQTLRRRLGWPLPAHEFPSIATQCVAALAVAHKAGILHGDIKPENIMLTPGGQVKILDFGIAHRLVESEASTTLETLADGKFAGTLPYMSPEVLEGKESDARADIFSLGVVFYEALSGQNPFRAEGLLPTCERILHEDPVRLREVNSEVPPELEQIIAKMLAKDPGQRYSSAADLAVDLRAIARPLSSAASSAAALKKAGRSSSIRRRSMAAGAVLLVLLSAVGYWTWRIKAHNREISSSLGAQPVRSITILPFRRIAGPREYDYFGVGLAEVLNAKLTNARLLELHYPGFGGNLADSQGDPLEIGRRLKVDAVLSGSYQIEEGTLSLSYTLLDVRRNVQIAGNAYSTALTQSLEVEHRLASEIVESLKVSGSQEELARFTAPPTQRGDAFQEFLRSKYEMDRFWEEPSHQQLSRAEQPLKEALQMDPHFTLALVSLAKLHWFSVFWGYAKDPGILNQAAEEAESAIAQDPGLGEAYAARALVEFQRGQLDRVRKSLVEAFSRSPHSALAYYAAGFYYLGRGLADDGVRAFRRAQVLDPEVIRNELAFAYRYQADLPRAEEQARNDLARHPNDLVSEASLAVNLISRGELTEVRKIERDLARRAPADPSVQCVTALVRVRAGEPFSVEAWLRRYHDVYWSDAGYCANVAGVLAVADQNSAALVWLRRAGELGMKNYPFLVRNPFYENLQKDRAFQDYLESVRQEWEQVKRREERAPLLPAGTP